MSLILLPRPDHLDEGPGRWSPDKGLSELLADVTVDIEFSGEIYFQTVEMPAGAYKLSADSNGISITSSGSEGRWNALMTLRQAIRQTADDGSLPDLIVEDEPAFAARGVMLDISRTRVPSIQTLKTLINLFSELKYNQLQLYTEHTFAFKGHEKVWKDASPFTGAEIEEIDRYCRNREIELIPNQNSFGHMERWLRHPEYHHIAEAPEGFDDPWGVYREFASTLDPSVPESIEFLEDLFDQLIPHFTSRNFNIGGDEPFDLGKGRSRERCETEGTGKVYLEFLNKIVVEVEKRGFKPQFWADIILNYPELLSEVPENVVVMNWGYESEHPFAEETKKLAESGRDFQVCPGTSSWNAIAGRWENARVNIRSAAESGLKNGASGLLVTDWGDNGHKQQYVVSMPGWFAASAAAWNGSEGVDEDIQSAIQMHVFGDAAGNEAEWLLRLSDLYKENPLKLHNMSFLALPLLDHEYPYYRTQYREISRRGMGQARDIARKAVNAIGSSPPDSTMWRDQLAFTAEISSFAADLAEPFFASESHSIEKLPVDYRKALACRLEKLMSSYSKLWLDCCRQGGLDESLDGFAGLLELLRT